VFDYVFLLFITIILHNARGMSHLKFEICTEVLISP